MKPLRIAVTGREGQVVRSLLEKAAAARCEAVAVGRPELDLTDHATVRPALERARPDVVISAAAYTAVDRAEEEPGTAAAVNAGGAGAVAQAASSLGVPVLHLSTDYVFAGDLARPYRETDPTGPLGVYGRTKLAGERAVAAANPRHVILRTAWVYSPFGRNFARTMLRLASERESVSVVSDQWGNPTSALDIADCLLRVSAAVRDDREGSLSGIYHLAGSGETNWAGFAQTIFAFSRELGGPAAEVREIATADYPTKAARPANSRLCTDLLEATFGYRAPGWESSCRYVTGRLLAGA